MHWHARPTDDDLQREGKQVLSIQIPHWASRITLIVEVVKVERLQAISRADAIAVGLSLASNAIEKFRWWPKSHHEHLWLSPPAAYQHLLNSLLGAEAWKAHPFVFALKSQVERAKIDRIAAES